MASGRLIDYMGYGEISARPAAPDLFTGTLGFYWATDENKLYAWDGAWAEVAPEFPPSAESAIASLTDSSGGTPDGTIAAVSGSGADADINNNFAELNAKVDSILTALRNLGLIAS
jgi:hypothetical protein